MTDPKWRLFQHLRRHNDIIGVAGDNQSVLGTGILSDLETLLLRVRGYGNMI